MILLNERDYERHMREFGEEVAANYAALPALPSAEFRWRLALEFEHGATTTTVRHRWVAEPCEVKP